MGSSARIRCDSLGSPSKVSDAEDDATPATPLASASTVLTNTISGSTTSAKNKGCDTGTSWMTGSIEGVAPCAPPSRGVPIGATGMSVGATSGASSVSNADSTTVVANRPLDGGVRDFVACGTHESLVRSCGTDTVKVAGSLSASLPTAITPFVWCVVWTNLAEVSCHERRFVVGRDCKDS